ncbi:MAG: OB-fold nucleic acid binding domain-containing protein [Acidobacteria bacterium]|jgi:3'-5' exoribonuclease|nr:OB-fold nucleic acid binding domain-containing protein [Acidobacteriota bacterium]
MNSLFDKLESKPQPLAGLKVHDAVNWFYRVQEINRRTSQKNKKDYLDLVLADRSGRMTAKVWDNVDTLHKLLQPGNVYRISGEVDAFNGKMQLKITRARPLEPNDNSCRPEDFDEQPPFDSEALRTDLYAMLDENLADPHLRQLVQLFKEEHGAVFSQAYGAQKIHHAFAGGLLQHTHALLRLVLAVSPFYGLDTELLLIGALFHDIGKTAEFKTQPALETTMAGGLLGHLVISLTIFLEMQKRIPGFPEPLSLRIQHLIVAHHGEKEFGSPEVPKTREAYVLHILDLLDSRLSIFSEQLKTGDGQKLFSEFNQALGTRILLDK